MPCHIPTTPTNMDQGEWQQKAHVLFPMSIDFLHFRNRGLPFTTSNIQQSFPMLEPFTFYWASHNHKLRKESLRSSLKATKKKLTIKSVAPFRPPLSGGLPYPFPIPNERRRYRSHNERKRSRLVHEELLYRQDRDECGRYRSEGVTSASAVTVVTNVINLRPWQRRMLRTLLEMERTWKKSLPSGGSETSSSLVSDTTSPSLPVLFKEFQFHSWNPSSPTSPFFYFVPVCACFVGPR